MSKYNYSHEYQTKDTETAQWDSDLGANTAKYKYRLSCNKKKSPEIVCYNVPVKNFVFHRWDLSYILLLHKSLDFFPGYHHRIATPITKYIDYICWRQPNYE